MIYDKPIEILSIPQTVGTSKQGRLIHVFSAYCAEKTVGERRYWDSVQADSQVDLLVELPLRRPVIAGMYALYGSRICRVEQAQFTADANGLDVTVLSLRIMEGTYDVSRP